MYSHVGFSRNGYGFALEVSKSPNEWPKNYWLKGCRPNTEGQFVEDLRVSEDIGHPKNFYG